MDQLQQPQAPQQPQPQPQTNTSNTPNTPNIPITKPFPFDYWILCTLVGALLVIIGVFIPFYRLGFNVPAMSKAGLASSNMPLKETFSLFDFTQAQAWVLMIGAVVIGILACFKQYIAALVVAIIEAIDAAFVLVGVHSSVENNISGNLNQLGITKTDGFIDKYMNVGFEGGAWLLIIGIILMLIGTVVTLCRDYNKQLEGTNPIMPPAMPTEPQMYNENGWQFGVPNTDESPREQVREREEYDNNGWQFGVPDGSMPLPDTNPESPEQPRTPVVETSAEEVNIQEQLRTANPEQPLETTHDSQDVTVPVEEDEITETEVVEAAEDQDGDVAVATVTVDVAPEEKPEGTPTETPEETAESSKQN